MFFPADMLIVAVNKFHAIATFTINNNNNINEPEKLVVIDLPDKMLVTTTTIEDFHGFSLVHLQKNINPTRPRLHSTGRIWELAEIHH